MELQQTLFEPLLAREEGGTEPDDQLDLVHVKLIRGDGDGDAGLGFEIQDEVDVDLAVLGLVHSAIGRVKISRLLSGKPAEACGLIHVCRS